MNEKSELNNMLCCKICNKNYKSKSSLCKYNIKKYIILFQSYSNNSNNYSNNILIILNN